MISMFGYSNDLLLTRHKIDTSSLNSVQEAWQLQITKGQCFERLAG